MNLLRLTTFLGLGLSAIAAYAGGVPQSPYVLVPGEGTNSETQGYVGLEWTLGSATPQIILGVKKVDVEADGDAQGFGAAVGFDVQGGFAPADVKLTVLSGDEKTQAEAGLGYTLGDQSVFLTGGANTAHASVGVDVDLDGNIQPYGVIHSQSKFETGVSEQCVVGPSGFGDFTDPSCTTPISDG